MDECLSTGIFRDIWESVGGERGFTAMGLVLRLSGTFTKKFVRLLLNIKV
jgi:hypothetical protein